MARWQTVNVLLTSASGRRLWQLSPNGSNFTVQGEKTVLINEGLPATVVGKDWHTLFRKKLNIAWLPADRVFLRVVHLPASESGEIEQMIELQLEKLSPLPVGQMVWSFYLMPRLLEKPDALQTVIVIIAARSSVEEFLGQLETEGYLADRLEAPGLDQLLATNMQEEGVWVIPNSETEPILIAWLYGGAVQNLTLLSLSTGEERGPQLKAQLEQIAWAGELEGWLSGTPKIHLVAAPEEVRFWEPFFKNSGEQLQLHPPATEPQLASLSARRCAENSSKTNLLPRDFSTRYHQQFVDGLWMRGLLAVLSAYIIGVLIYFGALYVLKLKYSKVKSELASISGSYTNALKDSAELTILLDRQELKYKALDCWRAVAAKMPDTLTLDHMYFRRNRLELRGTAVTDQADQVDQFNEAVRHIQNPNKPDQPLFSDVAPPRMDTHGQTTEWGFTCDLKEAEGE